MNNECTHCGKPIANDQVKCDNCKGKTAQDGSKGDYWVGLALSYGSVTDYEGIKQTKKRKRILGH